MHAQYFSREVFYQYKYVDCVLLLFVILMSLDANPKGCKNTFLSCF